MTVHHLKKSPAVTAAAARAAGADLAAVTARPQAKRSRAQYMRDYRKRNEPTVTTVTEPVTTPPVVTEPAVTTQRLVTDPALMGVHALIEGLRAGQAELERLGWEGKAARQAAKAERRQETRTKLLAFFLFVLMASLMIGFMYAGIVG